MAIDDVSPLTGDGGRLSGACSAPRDPPVRAGAELTGGGSVLRVDVRARRGPMLDVVIGGVEATVEVGEPSTRVQAGDRPAVLVRPDWASLGGPLPGSVVDSRFRGPATDHVLDTPVGRLAVRSTGASGSTHSSEGWSWHRGWVLPDPA